MLDGWMDIQFTNLSKLNHVYLGFNAVIKVAPAVFIDYGLRIPAGVEVNGADARR